MFDELLTALQATQIPFAAYAWAVAPDATYGVLSLDGGAGTLAGDNTIAYQAVSGSVDLYTKSTSTADAKTVQGVLNDFEGCAWRLNSVQYEDETGFIHFEWIIELREL